MVIWMHQIFFGDFTHFWKKMYRKAPKCKNTEGLWIQFTADAVKKLLLQNSISYEDMSPAYNDILTIKAEILKNLKDTCDYMPLKFAIL